jgi:hypothetical protein
MRMALHSRFACCAGWRALCARGVWRDGTVVSGREAPTVRVGLRLLRRTTCPTS